MMITPRHSAALVLLLAGCQDGTRAEPDRSSGGASGDPISLTRLAPDSSAYTQHSGIGSPRQAVVRDTAGWRQLWQEIHATITPVPELPEIDFDQEMVVVAALGSQPSGGYDVVFTGATRHDSTLTIGFLARHPSAGCMTTQALTQPADLARVPRHDGPVRFVESQAETSCGS